MIKWAALKFQPINLWSYPRQDVDVMRAEVNCIDTMNSEIYEDILKMHEFFDHNEKLEIIARRVLKEKEFIYYCHTGRFPE